MSIISFFKSLFGLNKKEEPMATNNSSSKDQVITNIIAYTNDAPKTGILSLDSRDKEVIDSANNKEVIKNEELIHDTSISESSDKTDSMDQETVTGTIEEEIVSSESFDPIPEEMEESLDTSSDSSEEVKEEVVENIEHISNSIELTEEEPEYEVQTKEEIIEEEETKEHSIPEAAIFSSDEIASIKAILRPIVRAYNYEKKSEFSHYAEYTKTIKCFLTSAKDSTLLIFRPTQSDNYNNNIGLFVRRCILKEFKDSLVAAGIKNLDIQCDGGRIKIQKRI